MSIATLLEASRLEPGRELDLLLEQAAGDGAAVSFVGVARARSRDGRRVKSVELQTHPVLTERSLEEIAGAAVRRFDLNHVRVVHRVGKILPGEPIVFAGASSLHRRAAFDAADYLMDRLKTDAVFWKLESVEDGDEWIEPTASDRKDRARWG